MTFVAFEAGQARRPRFRYQYRGPITAGVIATTSQSLRNSLAERLVEAATVRRIFSSYVELSYNILYHGVPETDEHGKAHCHGEVVVEERDGGFDMTATSRVSRDAASALQARIEQFRDMTREQLRFEYQLRLTNLQFEAVEADQRGAGLGLVTVARNARGPISSYIDCADGNARSCLLRILSTI